MGRMVKKRKPKTHIYTIWQAMKRRCSDKNQKQYKDYGGRGITVCAEWMNNSQTFCEWAMAKGYKKGLSLERINNNAGYSPKNCCFIPRGLQSRNQRSNLWLSAFGRKRLLVDWAKESGISETTIQTRLKLGWSVKDAVSARPYSKGNRSCHYLEAFGKRMCVSAWAREIGVYRHTIYYRLRNGKTVEEALSMPRFKR